MGRLFDTKENTTSQTSKGRLFSEPVKAQESALSKAGGFGKEVVKEVYKTGATIPVRAAQAEELLRTKAFGDEKSKKKAMEFASQSVNIGFGKSVKPLDTSSVGKASLQTAGDVLGTASLVYGGPALKGAGLLTKMAKGAAIQGSIGAVSGLATGLSEGKTIKESLPQAGQAGLISGVVGAAIPVAGKFLAKGAKVADEIPTNVTSDTITAEVIPESIPITSDAVPVINPKVTPDGTPVAPVAPTAKPISYNKDPVTTLTKTMETELPPNVDPTFVSTTMKNQTAQYDSVAQTSSVDDLIDMSMGLKPLPEGLNPVSIHALTSIRKDLTVEQAIRLKNIYPLSQAGQDLSLARLKSGAIIDNPIDMMQAVEKELKEQVSKKGVSKTDIKNLFPDCGFN